MKCFNCCLLMTIYIELKVSGYTVALIMLKPARFMAIQLSFMFVYLSFHPK